MRKILKATSILGVATLARIFSGLARAKFLAWQLGPIGVGLVGQAQMYSAFTIQLCALNMPVGVTKLISESVAQKQDDRLSIIVNAASTMQLIASLVFIAIALPFSMELTKFVFSDSKYWIFFVGITLVTPCALYMIGMAEPILYGLQKIVEYTKLAVLYTLLGLGLLFALVWFYQAEGALVQIIVLSIVASLLSYYFVKKKAHLRPKPSFSLFKDKDSRSLSSHLVEYGLVSFIPGTVTMFVMLFLRGLFMKEYGIAANGYYQVGYALSAYYLPFVTNGIWGHFYPQVSSLKEDSDINRYLNQFMRFALFASTAIAACCVIFRKFIILTLFSREFMNAYDLLAIQAVGDIFCVLFYMFNASLMARRDFRGVIFVQTIGYNLILVSLYYVVTSYLGFSFRSLNIVIALTNLALVIVHMVYLRLETGFILMRENLSLFIKSMAFLGLVIVLPDRDLFALIIKAVIGLAWFMLSATRDEVKGFVELLFSSFKRRETGVS